MARSFYGVMMQAARAAERSHRRMIRENERAVRQAEHERKAREREYLKQARLMDREARQAYLRSREQEVEDMNRELARRIKELKSVLFLSPESAKPLDFRTFKKRFTSRRFDPSNLRKSPEEPQREAFSTFVPPLSFMAKLLGGRAKHEQAVREATERDEEAYRAALEKYRSDLKSWCDREEQERSRFDEQETIRKREIDEHNAAVEEFEAGYRKGAPQSVIEYFSLVLDRSVLPEGFPEDFRLAYTPDSRQVVVEHLLPTLDVIPATAEYSYAKTKDEILEKDRKKAEIRELYEHVVAGTSLRIINELFSCDSANVADVVVFNGIVDTVSPATGESIRPCIVSVRVSRPEFSKIVLDRVDPVACLRTLGAVSKRPEELAPVRPIIEFDMADPRFIKETDVLTGIESRPNIMELSPSEFESLVTNLFSSMGLEARQTRASRDGGVDAVAFDPRPVLGGKVVVQAKRYKNTVGVAAVRDLYGTMINEGANKGILVTTAGYGTDAFEFARDKPIELIDGPGLLYLLEEQGFKARILMPS